MNHSTTGHSRADNSGPDSLTVSKLISDWLLTINGQDGVFNNGVRKHSLNPANPNVGGSSAVDMELLMEHVIIMYLFRSHN